MTPDPGKMAIFRILGHFKKVLNKLNVEIFVSNFGQEH